jgi:2,4-dienoyl-CoA reductase-like NADH-dependent reductase (Old Yellow Enzyme family)
MSFDLDLSPLFTELTVSGITLKNRWVMPAMQRGWAKDGLVTDRTVAYYRERAEGGTGLIISEGLGVDHPSADMDVGIDMHLNARTRDGWARCVDAVKSNDAHFLMQIWHPGAVRLEGAGARPDVPPLSPSGQFCGRSHGRATTDQDLAELKDAFVTAALTAQDMGCDGVEFHMAHGYLLHQFLLADSNQRADSYGGENMADRVRWPAELVAGVLAAARPDFVVGCRISQWSEADYAAKVARTPQELHTMIKALEAAGSDYFHMSTRYFHKPEWPDLSPLPIAGWVKTITGCPVITVGSVGLDIDVMLSNYTNQVEHSALEAKLTELVPRFRRGEFDLVAIGRSIIADPNFVGKVRQGRFDEIITYTKECNADMLQNFDFSGVPEEIMNAAAAEAVRTGASPGEQQFVPSGA